MIQLPDPLKAVVQQGMQWVDQAISRLTFKTREPPLIREEISVWDPRARLMDLTGYGDWLTLGDMYTGVAVFGAAGSGKTSSMAEIARILMELECGFVWTCAKPDEVHLVKRIAKAAGRLADVRVIGEDTDGRITAHRFNPLEYEIRGKSGTTSLVKYLSTAYKVLSREDGAQSSGGSSDKFWNEQFERLLRYCIDTAKFAGERLTMDLLRQIQLSAPKSQEQLRDNAWAEKSVCWQCLQKAETRVETEEVSLFDLKRVVNFWATDWLNLDAEPKSTIDVMMGALVDSFTAEEPVRSILTTYTTVTPDDVINNGEIIVLSLPTNVYHEAGRMAQFCFKYSFQRAMLRREKPEDGSPIRGCVLWQDEAHSSAHSFDSQYFAEVRSNRGINICLEQGVGGYMEALGHSSPEQTDRYLQNLATKFFFQNNSPQTNTFAADAIGKLMLDKDTSSIGQSLGGAQIGEATTQEQRHQIITGLFGLLRRGGPKNNNIVTGYVLRPEIFEATGTNVALCQFQQTELTK